MRHFRVYMERVVEDSPLNECFRETISARSKEEALEEARRRGYSPYGIEEIINQ